MSFALCPLLSDGATEALLDCRLRRAEGDLPGEAGQWPMDRHHEPDGAAGRQRPGDGAKPRRAAGRWHLQGLRHQDLHHVRRARHGREHRAPRAGARRRRAGRRQGHQLVRRAEVHGRQRRRDWRAQRRALRQHRAQARHQGLAHGGAAVRRPRRRRRLHRRSGEPRPRVHVHHDELGSLRRRHAGHRDRRARLPARGGLCKRSRAESSGRWFDQRQRADHSSP